MGKGALAFIAGLGTGYLNQKNREEEKARQEKFDQIALDRADRERQDYEKKQNLERSISEASKPGAIKYEDVAHEGIPMQSAQDPLPGEEPVQVASTPIASQGVGLSKDDAPTNIRPPMAPVASQGIGGYTRKVTFNGKEYADENAAKSDIDLYNKPEARDARIVQAYRNAGDHQAALDIEGKTSRIKGDAIHTEASQLNLNQAKEQEARLTFGRGMVNAYSSGGGAGLMSFLSDSHADGESGAVKFEQQLSPDGKIASVFKTTSKGDRIKVGDVPNTEDGWHSAMFRMQKGLDPNALFAHSAAIKKQEWEERKVSATEKKADAADKRADANDRRTDALIAGVIGQRGISGKQKEDAPIWDSGADKTLVGLFTRKDEARNETIDSTGILFAKKIGVAIASQNGGDSFSAAHQAATTDNRLRIKAGNDPQKLAELRSQYLDSISGQRANNPSDNTAQQPSPKAQGKPSGSAAGESPSVAPPVKASEYKGITYAEKLKQGMKTIGETIGSGIDYVKEKDQQIIRDRNLHEVKQRMKDGLDLNAEQKKIAIDAGLMIDDLKKTK